MAAAASNHTSLPVGTGQLSTTRLNHSSVGVPGIEPSLGSKPSNSVFVSRPALSHELSQFFETAFHLILHERSLYPSGLFDNRRIYGLSVPICRHPLLNQYIKQLVDGIQSWLVLGETQRIALVVLDPARSETNPASSPKCIERFVFEFCIFRDSLPPASTTARTTATTTAGSSSSSIPADFLSNVLYKDFASALTHITSSGGHFKAKRPKFCDWTVLLYTHHATPTDSLAAISTTMAATSITGGGGRTNRSSAQVFDLTRPDHSWQTVPITSASTENILASSSSTNGGASYTPFLDFPPRDCRILPLKSQRCDLFHMELFAEAL